MGISVLSTYGVPSQQDTQRDTSELIQTHNDEPPAQHPCAVLPGVGAPCRPARLSPGLLPPSPDQTSWCRSVGAVFFFLCVCKASVVQFWLWACR